MYLFIYPISYIQYGNMPIGDSRPPLPMLGPSAERPGGSMEWCGVVFFFVRTHGYTSILDIGYWRSLSIYIYIYEHTEVIHIYIKSYMYKYIMPVDCLLPFGLLYTFSWRALRCSLCCGYFFMASLSATSAPQALYRM